jgi:V/A-type H+-transporting ATPase subunit D
MKVRHPPGRAGRPWLARRLAVAERGAELLETKRRALIAERRRVAPLAAAAAREWEDAARTAELLLVRAAILGGQRQLAIARRAARSHAELTLHWHTVLGVRSPARATLQTPSQPMETGATAALLSAADAHRTAVQAAIRAAVLGTALARIERDLRAASLRRNAVVHRWIPSHAQALANLEIRLEELEREDGTRVRWAAEHSGLRSAR